MEVNKVYTKSEFCNSCLSFEDVILNKLTVHNEVLKSVFQENRLTLCQYCSKILHRVEHFVKNVQNVQRLFKYDITVDALKIQSATKHIEQVVHLETKRLVPITLSSEDDDSAAVPEDGYIVHHTQKRIKVEIKEENGENYIVDDYMDEEDVPDDSYSTVKAEDHLYDLKDESLGNTLYSVVKSEELHNIIKRELEQNVTKRSAFKKKNNKKKRKSNLTKNAVRTVAVNNKKRKDTDKIELVYLTEKEILEERLKMANNEKYMSLPLKCDDCLKGFTFQSTYDEHMGKHSVNKGDYVCDICKQRSSTLDKFNIHMKYHKLRYRCLECNLTRISRKSILEHYSSTHSKDNQVYMCQHCPKVYKRSVSLRKHILYSHRGDPRATCEYCQKSYANKTVLKSHLINKHTTEMGVELPRKLHVCQHCDKSFNAPSLLKKHQLKHTQQKDYYCVECDKNFKSDSILQHHLKTATSHVNYADLPYPCQHCHKRFSIRRDVQRHMNSVHLNVKPYQCDRCERAYVSKWSLIEHISLKHEGYKRPLRYPCAMCDKIFDRNHILKAHIRTHTGERPYQCSKCPANFSQSSILRTHVKLIHLKLTRDGREKTRR